MSQEERLRRRAEIQFTNVETYKALGIAYNPAIVNPVVTRQDMIKARNVVAARTRRKTSAVLTPQVTGGTQPVAMLALSGIAQAALAAAGSPTGKALIGGGLQALGIGGGGVLGLGTTTVSGQQTVYSAAFVRNGRIYVQTAKGWVAKGYTPDGAKKKYRKRPRRKRWTQRDEKQMQWQAYITSISAGRPGVPPI